ncbi:unnamed protein product [Caenorhabditis auriculariae]|uniref:BAR domain-containing protein n=1 Tax=Caenorhabditis auriculariae TaxID=2777116 RepID=A0A8S1GYF6_9PELO|nr:unnamed protein product [Caenorhabditis auriculariae]
MTVDDKLKDEDEPRGPGMFGKLYLKAAQKVGKAEKTKVEPAFQENINRVVKYHIVADKIVDSCEMQIQPDIAALSLRIEHAKDENPWELLAGWMTHLGTFHYTGNDTKTLERYSQAAAKIAIKERQAQTRSRMLIRKMRAYVSIESSKLNEDITKMHQYLEAIDESRHLLKESKTVNEVKKRGEECRRNIIGFNRRANNLQSCIDEMSVIIRLHQLELIRYCNELAYLNRAKNQILVEARLRLGRKK